ncbi:MAG: DUF2853 family protein [Planctomycetota bacterium]
MSQLDEVLTRCKAQMEEHGIELDEALLTSIAKSLGPSIYSADGLVVASSDEAEMATVHAFAADKLGAEASVAEEAVAKAVETLGSGNRQKLRPVVYYLITRSLGRESVFSG